MAHYSNKTCIGHTIHNYIINVLPHLTGYDYNLGLKTPLEYIGVKYE